MARSYEQCEVIEAACELTRWDPLGLGTMRSLAASLSIAPATLYRYVTDKQELVELAEAECWRRLIAELSPLSSLSERLTLAMQTMPGWLAFVADFQRAHVVPADAFRLIGAMPENRPAASLELTLGFVSAAYWSVRGREGWREKVSQHAAMIESTISEIALALAQSPERTIPVVDPMLVVRMAIESGAVSGPAAEMLQFNVRHGSMPTARQLADAAGVSLSTMYERSSIESIYLEMISGLVDTCRDVYASVGTDQDRVRMLWFLFATTAFHSPGSTEPVTNWGSQTRSPVAHTLLRSLRDLAAPEHHHKADLIALMLLGFQLRATRSAAGQSQLTDLLRVLDAGIAVVAGGR